MGKVASSLGTSQPYIPLISKSELGKLAGTSVHYDTLVALNAAIAVERTNIASGSGFWPDLQRITCAAESPHVYRVWSVSGQHARLVVVRTAFEVLLPADSNTILLTSGAPSAGTGANGDMAIDYTAGLVYLKASGVWVVQALKLHPVDVQAGALASSTTVAASPTAVMTHVANAINTLVNGAGASLDTLNELSAALGNDPNFATSIASVIAAKLPNTAGAVGATNLADGAITSQKLAPITTKTYLGRSSSGTGPMEGVPASTLRTDLGLDNAAVVLPAVDLTGSNTLTAAAHAFRAVRWTGTAPATQTMGAGVEDAIVEFTNNGTDPAAVNTFANCTTPTGYRATLGINETGQIKYSGGAWKSLIPALAGGGSFAALTGVPADNTALQNALAAAAAGASGAIMTVSGTRASSATLTSTFAAGYSGTRQWFWRGGADISGATGATYAQVSADVGHYVDCRITSLTYVGLAGALTTSGAPAQVTGLTISAPTSTSLTASWTAPSGTPTDYLVEYKAASSGTWLTFAHTASAGTSIAITGLTAATSYNVRVSGINGAGTGTASAPATASTASGAAGRVDTFQRANESPLNIPSDGGSAYFRAFGNTDLSLVGNSAVNEGGYNESTSALAGTNNTTTVRATLLMGQHGGSIGILSRVASTPGNANLGALAFFFTRDDDKWHCEHRYSGNSQAILPPFPGPDTGVGSRPADFTNFEMSIEWSGDNFTCKKDGGVIFTGTYNAGTWPFQGNGSGLFMASDTNHAHQCFSFNGS